MKKIIFAFLAIFFINTFALAKISVSQQVIRGPYYEGCVLVYPYGRDYSKCNNQKIYQNGFYGKPDKSPARGLCKYTYQGC